jgi:hypothetical protein
MDNSHEEQLTTEESLQLIARTIIKAKGSYFDTGMSSLLWGGVITFCSLATFANHYLKWSFLGYVWYLTLVAVVPQIIISIRENRDRKFKAHENDLMDGIWISFAIAIFLLSWVISWLNLNYEGSIYMIVYGIPTFATGYGRRFRPMVIGGIACWVFALLALLASYPFVLLYLAAAAQLAWFIPGLILRKSYREAKRKHV